MWTLQSLCPKKRIDRKCGWIWRTSLSRRYWRSLEASGYVRNCRIFVQFFRDLKKCKKLTSLSSNILRILKSKKKKKVQPKKIQKIPNEKNNLILCQNWTRTQTKVENESNLYWVVRFNVFTQDIIFTKNTKKKWNMIRWRWVEWCKAQTFS